MVTYCSKYSPTWTTVELLNLLSIWGEEAVQSQLPLSCWNFDTYGQISQGFCKKGYDRVMLQCRAKIKELRQVHHKVKEANHRTSASPKACPFYKELDAILSGDTTSTTKSPVDASAGLEAVERGPNPEDEIVDEKVELDDNVELPMGPPSGSGSQKLFSTLEVSSQSQQLLSSEQEAGEETPASAHYAASKLLPGSAAAEPQPDLAFWSVGHGWRQPGGMAVCPGALGGTAVVPPATSAPGSVDKSCVSNSDMVSGQQVSEPRPKDLGLHYGAKNSSVGIAAWALNPVSFLVFRAEGPAQVGNYTAVLSTVA
ncbi:Zinc finger and SCAN domain-containing protein 20 [Chelonia mydas]|uniref:Zinc finger and SCAN domain-containing protein 20 n=1 Tax=Chelonia mydas TaxID=8469 RepID=M7BT37_CHEMY|nr:Zinc finger and SCAN domain-containing protein 20 [Chelonia mydas]